MPDETQPEIIPADATAHNAEIAAKLIDQSRDKPAPTEAELQHSSDALDALAKDIVEKKAAAAEAEHDEPAPATPPVVAATEPTAEEKAKREAIEADRKRADEFFKDSPKLPPGASPKSSEAFSTIKIKAAQEIAARDSQLEETRKQLAEAQEKLKNAIPPEIEQELADHRNWRAKLDVEADPKFREFDKQVNSSREFIYAQLAKSPAITPEVIEKIKAVGGPELVKLEKIFDAMKDPTLQRIIEAKVADIEQAKWNKEQAIKGTKANIVQYLEERTKAFSETANSHNVATREQFDKISGRFPWYAEKALDPKADDATRKSVEEHNAFVKQLKPELESLLNEDSPKARAIMVASTAQAVWLKRLLDISEAKSAAAEKALAEATAKLEKLKVASVGRFQNGAGAAPSKATVSKPSEKDIFNTRASDALDGIAQQIQAERARASAA